MKNRKWFGVITYGEDPCYKAWYLGKALLVRTHLCHRHGYMPHLILEYRGLRCALKRKK